jgi:hypothetical protein
MFFLSLFLGELEAQVITKQKGVASYYAPALHGRRTSNGERYNKNDYTAAHRTLPFNTVLKVTFLQNNNSVLVRVNDRGPYAHNRLIDVSGIAARELGLIGPGFGMVLVEVVDEQLDQNIDLVEFDLTVRINRFNVGHFYDSWGNEHKMLPFSVLIDEVHDYELALSIVNNLLNEGWKDSYIQVLKNDDGHEYYRVLSGKYSLQRQALKHEEELRDAGRFCSIISLVD